MPKYPSTDADVKEQVYAETSYEDSPDELPDSQLGVILDRAKGRVELRTGSDAWYSDDGLGYALVAYTCMRAKASMENIPLDEYELGAESVSFDQADPEQSQILNQWAEDVRIGLNASDVDTDDGSPSMSNTAGYIGSTGTRDDPHTDRYR